MRNLLILLQLVASYCIHAAVYIIGWFLLTYFPVINSSGCFFKINFEVDTHMLFIARVNEGKHYHFKIDS